MTTTIPTEDQEQAAFVEWFRLQFPKIRIFAIPNGGFRHRSTANTMKATGVVSGVPDLFVPAWNLWIEMKRRKGGKVSPEQKDWLAYLESHCGHSTLVCYGCEDARNQVLAFRKVAT